MTIIQRRISIVTGWALFLGALALVSVPFVVAHDLKATSAPAWVESWAGLAAWHPVGSPQSCAVPAGGYLTLTCQSYGLATNQTWARQFPIVASVTVSASAAPGSTNDHYFAGVTLYNDDGGDWNYGEITLARKVPPFQGVAYPLVGSLVNESGVVYAQVQAATAHLLEVRWLPAGLYEFWMDGAKLGAQVAQLYADPAIFILCVSVGENTPNDGSAARCRFGPLTVTGTPSQSVRHLYLPVIDKSPPGGYP